MTAPRRRNISAECVRDIFDYESSTGILRWKYRQDVCAAWNGRWPGKCAGSRDSRDGYLYVAIWGERVLLHRVIWLWMTGEWPSDQIDHIDGNRANNRFSNLRSASARDNSRNVTRSRLNTSGFKGVCYHKARGRWQAQIRDATGQKKYLGLYDTPEDAYKAYIEEARRLHGSFARYG